MIFLGVLQNRVGVSKFQLKVKVKSEYGGVNMLKL